MRSYYAHLSTMAPPDAAAIVPKPVFRSSAIFPVFHSFDLSSRIIFLGYWKLKRKIGDIAAVISLRAMNGELLARIHEPITEAKGYSFELKNFLVSAGLNVSEFFSGSFEIEFYSAHGLVFPYPAVAINYYGPDFSTVVHTAQRVYNDYDDLQKNSQTLVPESGFNLYADENFEPLISLINGPLEVLDAHIDFEFFNLHGECHKFCKQLGQLDPYETSVLYPAEECGLKEFLQGSVGFCRARFNVNWIFPRLLVGNVCRQPKALSITHTYYDCVTAASESDYWTLSDPQWHPATLMVPLSATGSHFTNLNFYPICSASKLAMDIEIYNHEGQLVAQKKSAIIVESPGHDLKILKLKELLHELGIDNSQNLAVRIIAVPLAGSRVPARIKLGLDIGNENIGLPCNICTNLQPFNPNAIGKQRSFKWAPLLADQPLPTLWMMNSSPEKQYQSEAQIELTFYREKDTEILIREMILPANGFMVIDVRNDEELRTFFQKAIGWCTIVTNNSYLTTYYFTESSCGLIGGDHGF